MASTTDFRPASKTYKATRPNPETVMELDDWIAPILAAAGAGWGSNFRNLKVQSVSLTGWVNFNHDGESVGTAKPAATYAQKMENHSVSDIVTAYGNMVEQLTAADSFAEDAFGAGATAAADPDKVNYRAVVKGEVMAGATAESGWVEFTATFSMKKVELSNYIVQGVPGPKVDTYLETLDGYKTEA